MKLLAVAGDIDSLIAGIRLVTPLKVLAAEPGWSLVLRSFHDCRRADLLAADVLIVQRGASGDSSVRCRGAVAPWFTRSTIC